MMTKMKGKVVNMVYRIHPEIMSEFLTLYSKLRGKNPMTETLTLWNKTYEILRAMHQADTAMLKSTLGVIQ